jgi:hypothetical protein
MSLMGSKTIADELFNIGVYQTDDRDLVYLIERVCGDVVTIEKPREELDPITDVYYNGEWIPKERYEKMCEEAQKAYDMLPEVIKKRIDVYIHMKQVKGPIG